jgi:hypothetical protein
MDDFPQVLTIEEASKYLRIPLSTSSCWLFTSSGPISGVSFARELLLLKNF